jgi:6-phospho-3-hexuloisomerase
MNSEEAMTKILGEIEKTLRGIGNREVELLLDTMEKAKQIFCAGSGRSGLVMRAFAMRLMHMGLQSYVVGETVTPGIEKGDLLIIGSGSGETGSLLGMAEKAKGIGADVALLTVIPGSSISRHADLTITIPATTAKVDGPSLSDTVQSRGSLFEQCLFIFLESLVLRKMERSGFEPDNIMMRHANLE